MTNDLTTYIRAELDKSRSAEEIKQACLLAGWPSAQVNSALQKSQGSLSGLTSLPNQNSPDSNPTTQEEKTAQESTPKPKSISIISWLFYLITLVYTASAIMLLAIRIILDQALSAGGGLDNQTIKYFPSITFIPLIPAVTAIWFLYCGFKVRNQSKVSFWIALASSLFLPFTGSLIIRIILASLFSSSIIAESGYSSEKINLLTANPWLLLPLLIVGVLIYSRKQFTLPSASISKKSRIALVIVTLLILGSIIGHIGYSYIQSLNTDFGYTQAQSQVNYHIYRPTQLPPGLDYSTHFSPNRELANQSNAVQVTFSSPLNDLVQTGDYQSIILKQVGVNSGFSLSESTSSLILPNPTEITSVNYLVIAQDKQGLLIRKTMKTRDFYTLVFVTADDVLVTVTCLNLPPEQLVEFANLLK